ncbi:conserved hypothetical protein [Theileria orientalis strain Shintoku]|uniref:Uncharacterized protein n=1 Tax=Theileria orientalis strain Shintoku TaxID=869250 RepID=J7MC95_THEOR|nr:conserved hypothetical protein [Theileria orientalis strain Shintoku]BAM42372.1 conserved hypothetical protein [Theileria orientalis strain Shintoku]|eukprot:XP_009692673.1 conserved hypothetical protein [Theileria orientalis strain Shintoku]
MRPSLRLYSHESPRIQAPKDAGVVFSNQAFPLRYVLNIKPWLFLCVVGFSGTFCGNYFYKRFLLRPNPPNPKRDPNEKPPERHPHAPEEE